MLPHRWRGRRLVPELHPDPRRQGHGRHFLGRHLVLVTVLVIVLPVGLFTLSIGVPEDVLLPIAFHFVRVFGVGLHWDDVEEFAGRFRLRERCRNLMMYKNNTVRTG